MLRLTSHIRKSRRNALCGPSRGVPVVDIKSRPVHRQTLSPKPCMAISRDTALHTHIRWPSQLQPTSVKRTIPSPAWKKYGPVFSQGTVNTAFVNSMRPSRLLGMYSSRRLLHTSDNEYAFAVFLLFWFFFFFVFYHFIRFLSHPSRQDLPTIFRFLFFRCISILLIAKHVSVQYYPTGCSESFRWSNVTSFSLHRPLLVLIFQYYRYILSVVVVLSH